MKTKCLNLASRHCIPAILCSESLRETHCRIARSRRSPCDCHAERRRIFFESGSSSHGRHDDNLLSPPPPDFQEYLNRAEARSAIANEVLAERMTLSEAADAYLEILGDRAPQVLQFIPGKSSKEKMGWQVITIVRGLEQERGLPGTMSNKLEIEFKTGIQSD